MNANIKPRMLRAMLTAALSVGMVVAVLGSSADAAWGVRTYVGPPVYWQQPYYTGYGYGYVQPGYYPHYNYGYYPRYNYGYYPRYGRTWTRIAPSNHPATSRDAFWGSRRSQFDH